MSKLLSKAKGFITRNYMYTMFLSVVAVSMAALAPTFSMAAGLDNVLKNVGTIGGIVVGIIAVIIVIMEAPKIAKGEKAAGSTVAKVLLLLLFAGLMIVASNIQTLQGVFGGIAQSATSVAADTASSALG